MSRHAPRRCDDSAESAPKPSSRHILTFANMISHEKAAAISSALLQFQNEKQRNQSKIFSLVQAIMERKAKRLFYNTFLEPADVVGQMWLNLLDPKRIQVPFDPTRMTALQYLTGHLRHAADDLRREVAPQGTKTKAARDKDYESRTVRLIPNSKEFDSLIVTDVTTMLYDFKILKREVYRLDKVVARGLRLMSLHGLSQSEAAEKVGLTRFTFSRRVKLLREKLNY